MSPREIALAYLDAFCAGDIPALGQLLADDLRFTGPFHQFTSSAAYLESLAVDPPGRCGHSVLSITESDGSVAVFWEYRRPERPLAIAQLFRIRNHEISEIFLVFDTGAFAQPPAAPALR